MTSAASLRRLEFSLAALGLTVALGAVLLALDAVRFHTALLVGAVTELKLGEVDPAGVALLALTAAEVAIVLAALRSVVKQVLGQRALLRRLPVVARRTIAGETVIVVDVREPLAFCAGFVRPRIYVSTATIALLAATELHAVVAHEGHHASRRDPLRLLVAGAFASGFSILPGLRSLRRSHAALAEIAADAAAVRRLGDPAPLASALLAFDGSGGVAPERVDHLLGDAKAAEVPAWLLLAVASVLAVLAIVAMWMLVWPGHPPLPPVAPLCTLVAIGTLVALTAPAWLASRHVTRSLTPAP